MLMEIMTVEREIGRFRGNFHNYGDYIPLLQLLPLRSNKLAISCRNRRDRYMDILLNALRKNIENGTCRSCITGNILQDPTAKVSEQELKSICLTMVSAGLDTVPAMLIYFIGHMSQDYGQLIQKKAYETLENAYPDGKAWFHCLKDDNLPYIQALVKETLRFSAMPISLPRQTIQDIPYKDTIIPSNTTLFLNAFAANFDPLHYNNPTKFYPERFLNSSPGPPHFAFGAGTRMCAGANLAERELYTAFVRIISSFHILPPTNPRDAMESDPKKLVKEHNSLMIEPPHFKVRLVPRNIDRLKEYLKEC